MPSASADKTNALIREVPFWEVLGTKVEDGVFYVEGGCGTDFEIGAVGLVEGGLVAGKKKGETVRRGPIAFDEQGLACYDSEICGKSVKEYDLLFFDTYQRGFAGGMGWFGAHRELIESVRLIALKENEKVRRPYGEFKTGKLPGMVALAEDRIKTAEYSGTEPSYSDEHLVEAASKAKRVHEYTTRKDESELFRIWYVKYLKSMGYEKKVQETYRLYKLIDYQQYLASEINSLKKNGFRMVSRSQIPHELSTLRRKAAAASRS